MRFLFASVLIFGSLVCSEIVLGHGKENHAGESQAIEESPDTSPATPPTSDEQSHQSQQFGIDDQSSGASKADHEGHNALSTSEPLVLSPTPGPLSRFREAIEDFTLNDFPTLHPMVVHVPVIMIPVAFVFGLISIFVANQYFVTLALTFASMGVIGGYVAAFPMHPHTRDLSEAAARTLQQHDFFAYSTLGVTALAVLAAVFALLGPNIITKGLLAVILLLSSLCVSVTAHYGGTLTYIHGVGVRGNFLDAH